MGFASLRFAANAADTDVEFEIVRVRGGIGMSRRAWAFTDDVGREAVRTGVLEDGDSFCPLRVAVDAFAGNDEVPILVTEVDIFRTRFIAGLAPDELASLFCFPLEGAGLGFGSAGNFTCVAGFVAGLRLVTRAESACIRSSYVCVSK